MVRSWNCAGRPPSCDVLGPASRVSLAHCGCLSPYYLTFGFFVYRSAVLVRLVERRNDAEEALRDLEKAKDQLVESEKMASLGQLVGGLAHELNTPIGIAVTANSVISERLDIESGNFESDLEEIGAGRWCVEASRQPIFRRETFSVLRCLSIDLR